MNFKKLNPVICLIFFSQIITYSALTLGNGNASVPLGRVLINQPFEKEIAFENSTDVILQIENIQLSTPLKAKILTPTIKPGGTGKFILTFGKIEIAGVFNGLVRVNFKNNPTETIEFNVEAYLVSPIEFKPKPFVVVVTQRGVSKNKSIEIVNHRDKPLKLSGIKSDSDRFVANLHTLKPGQNYRVDLLFHGKKKAGRKTEWIEIINDDENLPILKLMVNSLVREKVYTYPESVDMGALPLKVAKDKKSIDRLTQILMIYKPGATDFKISAESDMENIEFAYEPGSKGDRYQFAINLKPEKVIVGKFKGEIRIKTNDVEFPLLSIPIIGEILSN